MDHPCWNPAEEELFDDPWKLLVACMLLNKTSGAQVQCWLLLPARPIIAGAIVHRFPHLLAGSHRLTAMAALPRALPLLAAALVFRSLVPAKGGQNRLTFPCCLPAPLLRIHANACPPPLAARQVRKVIWDLFALCPTPAAAIAVDVQQVQVCCPRY